MSLPENSEPKSWSVSRKGTEPPAPAKLDALDLFTNAGSNENGYARWRAENEAERAAETLPVNADDSGYEQWKTDAANQRAAFENRWGIRLGRRVRIQLRGEPREREGLLHLVDELTDSAFKGTRPKPLRLRMGDHIFLPVQIESLSVVD